MSARWGIRFVLAAGITARVSDAVAQAPPPLALRFEAPSGAVLLGRSGPTEDWQPVCTGPCYRFVDRSWTYSWRYSDGNGEFMLERVWPEGRARVVLLRPPPKAYGEVPLVAGAVAYSIGGAMEVFALFSIADPNPPWLGDVLYTGLGLVLAGTVLVIAGAIYKTSVPKSWTAEVTWFVPHSPVVRPTIVDRETRGALPPPNLGVPIVQGHF